jgi:hypothetical protein
VRHAGLVVFRLPFKTFMPEKLPRGGSNFK